MSKVVKRWLQRSLGGLVLSALVMTSGPAFAELRELRFAYQQSMAFLVVDVVVARKFVESRVAAAGLGEVKVSTVRFASGPAANEALLKGDVEIGGAGITPFLELWQKTRGAENVRGLAPINDSPLTLITTDPKLQKIEDYTPADKIAVPAPGSIQGLFLRMLSDRAYGTPGRLDANMASMTSPEALKALGAADGGVRSYVGSIPFNIAAMAMPGARELANSYALLGGPHNLVALFTTEKFQRENPKLAAAVVAAIEDAMAFIKAHPDETAEIFSSASKGATPASQVKEVLALKEVSYSPVPRGTMALATFLQKTGVLTALPSSWKDFYWPAMHGKDGS